MAGIKHLADIYRKKGKTFVSRLFDNYVTINEKIDGSAFSVERNPVTREMVFYKRDDRQPISMVDRTLARFYEAPIEHFENLPVAVRQKMPPGWRFGFEYLATADQQDIVYDRTPKNNLILSYIHVKDTKGNIVRTIQEKSELDKWANAFDVETPPIIFQGVLNDTQKIAIMEFIDTPKDNQLARFKTESFVKYLISVLNPKLRKTILNTDLDKPIEGVVFRFGANDSEVVLAKMVDPVFQELARNKAKVRTGGSDIYHVTLLEVMNFINGLNLNRFKGRGRKYDERYIDFICKVFNAFVDEYGEDYEDMDYDEPEYLRRPEFDINLEFIKDPVALSNIDRADGLKKLFKIMLASFKKRRRNVNGIFTKPVIDQFNLTVDSINAHLRKQEEMALAESEIPLFGDFIEQRGRPAEEEEEEEYPDEKADEDDLVLGPDAEDRRPTEEEEKFDGEKFKQSIPAEDEEDEIPEKKKKKGKAANLIVGRFQPFHNGHMSMVEELYAANKKPVMIVAVHPGHNRSGHSPLSMTTIRTMLENVKRDGKGKVLDYRIVGRGFISDIVEAMRPEYEPLLWGCGEDRLAGYQKQLEHNFQRKNELDLSEDFTIMETTRKMEGSTVRDKVYHDEFGEFKAMVPKGVQSLYPIIRGDIIKYEREKSEE